MCEAGSVCGGTCVETSSYLSSEVGARRDPDFRTPVCNQVEGLVCDGDTCQPYSDGEEGSPCPRGDFILDWFYCDPGLVCDPDSYTCVAYQAGGAPCSPFSYRTCASAWCEDPDGQGGEESVCAERWCQSWQFGFFGGMFAR